MKYIKNWEKWIQDKNREQILKKIIDLHELIEVDELTGILNRRAFNRELKYAVANYKRYKIPFNVVNFDLKKFKKINDDYGHKKGDAALIFFAEFLKKNVRDTDFAFRISGDEFMTILGHTNAFQAKIFIKRFIDDFKNLKNSLPEGSIGKLVDTNFGSLQWGSKNTIESFLRKLDAKMYEQKRS